MRRRRSEWAEWSPGHRSAAGVAASETDDQTEQEPADTDAGSQQPAALTRLGARAWHGFGQV